MNENECEKSTAKSIVLGVVMVMALSVRFATATGVEETAGLAAAEKRIALVDAGKYDDSWKEAAASFKAAVTQKKWTQQVIQPTGESLGKIISRKVKIASYQSNLPGAPGGELVVVRFETSYQNMKSAVEMVTLLLDKDGQWRVWAYSVTSGALSERSLIQALLLFLPIVVVWFMELKPKLQFFKKDR